jgi:3'5'-cyclic nucleotide phosphodiesterase
METTCLRGRIQVSQATADLIVEASKGHWLTKRDDVVEAKGKGRMQTYWLELKHGKSSASGSGSTKDTSDTYSDRDDSSSNMSEWSDTYLDANRNTRLVDWTVEVLRKLLKQVVARREAKGTAISNARDFKITQAEGSTVLDEVAEVIALPAFDAKVARKHKESSLIFLGEDVEMQLHAYVTNIAFMYSSENAFHNFEHVAHVIMSVTKLLSRVVAPSAATLPSKDATSSKPFKNRNEKDIEAFMASIAHDAVGQFVVDRTSDQNRAHSNAARMRLHDHTYGITGDPLVQFACVFSALIHDCGHEGIPNARLCKEKPEVASNYKHKSVAEQVSVDLAWTLLQEDAYTSLRNAIYSTKDEMHRFRQLVVNSVMATDIMDKDLKVQRNARWEKAFDTETKGRLSREQTNRRATIVIEHIIQASDVAHTMQHFDQFIHWNARLFKEMKTAYEAGRAEKDPAEFWYEGELGFFDFYVVRLRAAGGVALTSSRPHPTHTASFHQIPLAKKLKDCGVFGVTSAECLNYAMINRAEWEHRGRQAVAEYVQSFEAECEAKCPS